MIKRVKSLSDLQAVYASGLLFVGDPHLSMRKPSRRLDEDYLGTIEGKLKQVAEIANSNELSVVILGDLFDNATEREDNRMLSVLFSFLTGLEKPVFCLAGNHDLTETKLTPDTTLAMVANTGLLHVVAEAGVFARFVIGGETVLLGGTPSGQEIPGSVPLSPEARAACATTIWITHEDLAFPGAYPGALPFKAIDGVSLVVNGHMHKEQPERVEGQTTWFNPGNIIRKTVSDKDHVPAVWSWRPEIGLSKHRLSHVRDAFDLEGYQVGEAAKADVTEALKLDEMTQSMFADLLRNDIMAGQKTQDGGMITDLIAKMKQEAALSEPAELIVNRLLNSAIAEG